MKARPVMYLADGGVSSFPGLDSQWGCKWSAELTATLGGCTARFARPTVFLHDRGAMFKSASQGQREGRVTRQPVIPGRGVSVTPEIPTRSLLRGEVPMWIVAQHLFQCRARQARHFCPASPAMPQRVASASRQ